MTRQSQTVRQSLDHSATVGENSSDRRGKRALDRFLCLGYHCGVLGLTKMEMIMKKTLYIAAGIVLGLTTVHASAYEWWTPSELTNAAAWYDAMDADTLKADWAGTIPATTIVGRWLDKSGNGNHAMVWDNRNKPKTGVATIGGSNAVSFVPTASATDDWDDYLEVSGSGASLTLNVDGSGGLSIFAVMNYDPYLLQGNGSRNIMFGKGAYKIGMTSDNILRCWVATSGLNVTAGVLTNQDIIVSFTRNDTNTLAEAYSNGTFTVSNTGTVLSDNTDDLVIGGEDKFGGGSKKHYASVDFGEIILLRGAPSAETRQKVEGYLAHKWNLVSNLPADHPYKKLAPGQPPPAPAGTVISIR